MLVTALQSNKCTSNEEGGFEVVEHAVQTANSKGGFGAIVLVCVEGPAINTLMTAQQPVVTGTVHFG
jgi:hypothetical protein